MKARIFAPVVFVLALSSGFVLTQCSGASAGIKNGSSARPAQTVEAAFPDSLAPHKSMTRAMLIDSGRVYFQACAICHGKNGRGGRGPTLANSDYVQGDRTRLIRTVLDGLRDSIRVNGVRWKTGEMLGWAETWDDFKIAAVLTYVRTVLNDSLVTACIPEDVEAGTWASCNTAPRSSTEIATDSISVHEVVEMRSKLNLRLK
jgi:mono/diheme cytochrome c family protein